MKQPYLSIVIPAYNELDNFRRGVLDKVWQYLKDRAYSWEVIIVDDGSSDGSVKLLDQFCRSKPGFRLLKNPHQGKAGTVATGVKAARGQYILFTDFDQATPLSEFEKLKPYLENGYEVAIGSREVAGARREDEPFYRHLMGRGFNFGVRLLTVRGIADTQCGFKAFEGKVAKELFRRLQVYKPTRERTAFVGAFDVEILFIARRLGYKIAEVPVHWQHVETTRISPVKDSIRMALDVIRIRLYHLLGRYGK